MATKIIISRKSEWVNRRRSYKVFIDGKEVGKLDNGGSEEFLIEPGLHKVQCKINWCSSPELELEVKEGEAKFLKTGSGLKLYTAGYILFILSLLSAPLLKLAGIPRPENLSIIQLIVMIPFVLYLLYYLTIAKKQYAFLREDKENFFN